MGKGGRRSRFWSVGSMENSITCHQLSLPFRKKKIFSRHIIHERLLWSGKVGDYRIISERGGGACVYTYLEWLWSLVKEAKSRANKSKWMQWPSRCCCCPTYCRSFLDQTGNLLNKKEESQNFSFCVGQRRRSAADSIEQSIWPSHRRTVYSTSFVLCIERLSRLCVHSCHRLY